MHRVYFILAPCLAALACASPRINEFNTAGYGEDCGSEVACQPPLVCGDENTCVPSGTRSEGEVCVIDLDCADGLYCATGTCAQAGDGAEGSVCESSADCARNLRCSYQGLGASCTSSGEKYAGESCSAHGECLAGLLCDPSTQVCTTSLSAPAGEPCAPGAPDPGCAPELGYVCDPETQQCVGAGPDGAPIAQWQGISCPEAEGGDFRVLFEVNNTNEDFFRLPFPNDIRLQDGGGVDMSGFPTPEPGTVPAPVVQRFVDAYASELDGFGPNQAVFFRMSDVPLFCSKCSEPGAPTNCLERCMGQSEEAGSIYAVDLTEGSFAQTAWRAQSGDQPYICGPWVAVAPPLREPWQPGHTYAVFVHAGVRSATGAEMGQDADFAAMLSETAPDDAELEDAWDAYAPLRNWLAGSPEYPQPGGEVTDVNAGETVTADSIAAAAVFTVRDPTTLVTAVANAVDGEPQPVVNEVGPCADGDGLSCADPQEVGFSEIHGSVSLPKLQTGTAPYANEGGAIAVESGNTATVQGSTDVRFALSVPAGDAPAGGWPVVLYAHGTGGDYRTHITNGIAQGLASVAVGDPAETIGFAVLGIDQPLHGTRRGGSSTDPNLLFFNLLNPQAAKGNPIQGAADQLGLRKAVGAIDASASVDLDTDAVAFLGHSQGGIQGALALPAAQNMDATVLSGMGGGLIESLLGKTEPFPILSVVQTVIADPTLDAETGRFHPVMNVLQGYLEEVDPINLATHLSSEPLLGASPKHLLHVIGVDDQYTPNAVSTAYADRVGVDYVGPDDNGLIDAGVLVDPPVSENVDSRTQVSTVHPPADDRDGHFVLFDVDAADRRMQQFFGTWFVDGAPTVVD